MTVTIDLPDEEAGKLIQEFALRRQMGNTDILSAIDRTVARVVIAVMDARAVGEGAKEET